MVCRTCHGRRWVLDRVYTYGDPPYWEPCPECTPQSPDTALVAFLSDEMEPE